MTQTELWEHFLKRNPNLESDNPAFTKEGLKKFFDATFKAGYEHGKMQAEAMIRMRDASNPKGKGLGDLYDTIFGKGKL